VSKTPRTDALNAELYADAMKRKRSPAAVQDPYERAITLCAELESELADARDDAKSWLYQCSDRVRDWDEMRARAEKAESELAEMKNPSDDILEVVLREQQCWVEESDPDYEGGVIVELGMSQKDADFLNQESLMAMRDQLRLIAIALDAARKP
jgi:hypothetical protein